MEFDFEVENPFSTCDHNYPLLFQVENDEIIIPSDSPKSNPSSPRPHIVSFILLSCRNFDVFSCYLAINYMDRFLSVSATSIPEEKPWILRVIAVSCVSLALKMMKMDFSVSDLVQDGVVDPVTIERTEMLILGALKWRMRFVNPFCFMSFFILFLGIQEGDHTSIQAVKDRATHFILRAQNDMKLLEFKPSVISGAALLSAAREVLPSQLPHFSNSIAGCEYVSKVELFSCYEAMQEESRIRDSSLLDVASRTSNYLRCSTSSNSEHKSMSQINTTISSVDSELRVPKRRKIDALTFNL